MPNLVITKTQIMKKIYIFIPMLLIFICAKGQNQLQGHDPFPLLGGPFFDNVYDIAFNQQGQPWVGEGYVNAVPREIAWYNGASWNTIAAPPSIYNSFRQVEFDHNGILWSAGGNFFSSYDNGVWNVYDSSDIGIGGFNVTGLEVDKQNNKWFLAFSNDAFLVKYDGNNFTPYNISQMASDSTHFFRNGLFLDTIGNIYITSPDADSLLIFDGNTFARFGFFGLNSPAGYNVRLSTFDKDNNFLVMLQNSNDSIKIGKFTSGSWQFTPAVKLPVSFSFGDMTVDNSGRIWMCDGQVIICYDGTSWQTWLVNIAQTINKIISDNFNNIWITCEGMTSSNTVYRFIASSSQSIQGTIWLDANGNGVRDSLEGPVSSGVLISQQPDNWYSISSTSGNYTLAYSDSLQTYTVQCELPLYWIQTYPTGMTTINPSSQGQTGVDFGILPIPGITDVRVSVSAWNPRAGFNQTQSITYYNAGTDTISDTITYSHDPQFIFLSAIPTPDVISGSTLKWAYSSLDPGTHRNIDVTFHLDSLAILGDTLNGLVIIEPLSIDTAPADNQFGVTQVVRGPFDPNEKTTSPEGNISFNDRLTYTVFFQNTGTDTAFNVIVRDTIDSDLDISSFRVEGSSHALTTSISSEGGIEFRFANILLPDSNVNEPKSHGYVQYSIMPEQNAFLNTSVENTAYIYFDINAPIVTNTTQNIITVTLMTGEIKNEFFSFWPNPAADRIQLTTAGEKNIRVKITSILGREILNKQVTGNSSLLDIQNLEPGVYILSIEGSKAYAAQRFIKL